MGTWLASWEERLGQSSSPRWSFLIICSLMHIPSKVCQLEVDSNGPLAHLVFLFFDVSLENLRVTAHSDIDLQEMSRWPWPAPVALAPIVPCPGGWDPTNNPWDREHVMPIITTSLPQINSAVNMDSATLVLIKQSLEEGREACRAVFEGVTTWDKLFLPSRFFTEFSVYLEVTAWAQTEVLRWFGAVESRLRRLCEMLRNCPAISHVRIWPTPFPTFKKLGGFRRQDWYIGLCFELEEGEDATDTLRGPLHIFKDTCEDSARQFLATASSAFDLTWRLVERRQLPSEVVQCMMEDNTWVSTETPRGRFNYYYPNSAHWLSQSLREPPIASSTPPLSPICRSRSVSLSIPLEEKSAAQFGSFSFPSSTNLFRRPPDFCFPIKVPPPSLCDTSVPPPNPHLMDSHHDITSGKSRLVVKLLIEVGAFISLLYRLGSYLGEEVNIGWLEPASKMRCWQVV